jgi:hypothetical protein
MNVIAEVRRKRKGLAKVLKEYTGIRRIVEELYPDNAHFIYELLQNAEDTGATEVTFVLERDKLAFEHNGRSFSKDDILAITNIGEGTKIDDEEKIGRFGIGFKAVFAYCETPLIWSPTYSFKISDLVLPHELTSNDDNKHITRFEFPFNNPKKAKENAYVEIAEGLDSLEETTLLFLNNLETIRWKICDSRSGFLQRVSYSENHLEVLKQVGGKAVGAKHFLKFSSPVDGLGTQNASIAYLLEFEAGIKKFNDGKPLGQQMKVVKCSPGKVAVFFPADKENSGLRFHVHAPFVPELSRASIKNTLANTPLFEQLADLAAISLHTIRDLGLLTREFLAVLPNSEDTISENYLGILDSIVAEMDQERLTPIHGGQGHAPAKLLLQARGAFKALLSKDDLEFFHGKSKKWSVADREYSRVDRFLDQLSIVDWDINEMLDQIRDATDASFYTGGESLFNREQFLDWLSEKPIEWHQRFYAKLNNDLESVIEIDDIKYLPIVRLADRKYKFGSQCYFPGSSSANVDMFPRIEEGLYNSGKNHTQKKNARELLEKIGVREVGERDLIIKILKERYSSSDKQIDENTIIDDCNRFIALVEENPGSAHLFDRYFVFLTDEGRKKPKNIYLDQPYFGTGLGAYYGSLECYSDMFPLSSFYAKCGLSVEKFQKFVSCIPRIGVRMPVERQYISSSHPHRKNLLQDYYRRTRRTNTEIDKDWIIPGLSEVLESPSIELSKLIWTTLKKERLEIFEARYRPNQQYPVRLSPSSLCQTLIDGKWIPQSNGSFVRPADARHELLPKGFALDRGWEWLESIKFGANLAAQSEERRQKRARAKELGFEDENALERALKISSLYSTAEQENIISSRQKKTEQSSSLEQEGAGKNLISPRSTGIDDASVSRSETNASVEAPRHRAGTENHEDILDSDTYADSKAIRDRMEMIGMDEVIRSEEAQGRRPIDVSSKNLGYDIESFCPVRNEKIYIEVKTRGTNKKTFPITKNEAKVGFDKKQKYFLAIVRVKGEEVYSPCYIADPIQSQPPDGLVKHEFSMSYFLEKSKARPE